MFVLGLATKTSTLFQWLEGLEQHLEEYQTRCDVRQVPLQFRVALSVSSFGQLHVRPAVPFVPDGMAADIPRLCGDYRGMGRRMNLAQRYRARSSSVGGICCTEPYQSH